MVVFAFKRPRMTAAQLASTPDSHSPPPKRQRKEGEAGKDSTKDSNFGKPDKRKASTPAQDLQSDDEDSSEEGEFCSQIKGKSVT